MFKALFLLVLITGCATVSQPEAFTLSTGETVQCLKYEQMKCGMAIRGCGEHHSVDFECLDNVHYVGTVKAPNVDAPKEEGKTK